MAKSDNSGGLMSSAGIMRYFEAEDSAFKLDPRTVVIFAVVMGAAVMIMNYYFGNLW